MRPAWSVSLSIVCFALAGAALGCDGGGTARGTADAARSPDATGAETSVDAANEASTPDATAVDAPPDVACPASLPLSSWPDAPWDGGWQFAGAEQLVAFFDQLAQSAKLVVPAHQIDCTLGGVSLGECNYDPLQPERDAADTHYSDALDRFVGPDGNDYVWVHVAQGDLYVLAVYEGTPASYDLVLSYVRCHGSQA